MLLFNFIFGKISNWGKMVIYVALGVSNWHLKVA